MKSRDAVRLLTLIVVLGLILSACGGGPAATATPSGGGAVPTATPGGPTATAGTPTPKAAATLTDEEISKIHYPKERIRELLAEGFLLHGMMYGAGEEPKYGGVATFTHRLDIPSSDPMMTSTISLTGLTKQLRGIGNLVRETQQNNWEIEPYLATSWDTSADFKVWTFKMRADVKWHDGKPVTAEDMKFFIDLSVWPPAGRRQSSGAPALPL